ncbi:hypothetical protein MTR67_001798, partial [Solanum verrucosum]
MKTWSTKDGFQDLASNFLCTDISSLCRVNPDTRDAEAGLKDVCKFSSVSPELLLAVDLKKLQA